jgi:hypothetical protein
VLTGLTDGVLARGIRESAQWIELETFILDNSLPEVKRIISRWNS